MYLKRLKAEKDDGILRVSFADKLHNARRILRDIREIGDEVWKRFNAPPDRQLWYYRSLLEIFQARLKSPMVFELDDIVRELERRVTETSLSPP